MSEDLLYNRDSNFSGIDTIDFSDYAPSYGSRVSFSSYNYSYKTKDNYYNLIPLSANSLIAAYDMKYEVNEGDSQKLANFLESTAGTGDFNFSPDSGIYKGVPCVCEGYNISHIDNQSYELDTKLSVLDAPNLLNWSGGCFVNGGWSGYVNSVSYKKYDVVYTGVNDNKLNNFFYCIEDHIASHLNSPTGSSSSWTQEFFFEPDVGASNDVKFDVTTLEFKNSFKKKIKTNNNVSTFPISYKFTNISTHQLKSILHFLENKGGYRRFKHQIPSVYNRPKVFYCPEWTHTWKYYNSHELDVSFIEDPLGIVPK
jgi:phage-related protein